MHKIKDITLQGCPFAVTKIFEDSHILIGVSTWFTLHHTTQYTRYTRVRGRLGRMLNEVHYTAGRIPQNNVEITLMHNSCTFFHRIQVVDTVVSKWCWLMKPHKWDMQSSLKTKNHPINSILYWIWRIIIQLTDVNSLADITSCLHCWLWTTLYINVFQALALLILILKTSYYNSSSVCAFVCSPTPSRSFNWSSPNLVGVCRWTSELPLRGSFLKRSTGQTSLFRSRRHQAETTPLQKACPAKGTRRLRV